MLTATDLALGIRALQQEMDTRSMGDTSGDPFAIEPLPLDRWLADGRWIDLGFTPSPEQMRALRFMERVFFNETWADLGWDDDKTIALVNFIVLKWGKGGGKDTLSQVAFLRIAYLLICLKSPQRYYGIGLHSTIHLLNTAVSAPQANTVFYNPLKNLIEATPWWGDYAESGDKRALCLVNKVFFANQVELISGHSDTASQEGLNLLASVADEIAEFRTKEEIESTQRGVQSGREAKQSAEGLDNMMRSSGRSRFPEVHKCIYLSWTRFRGDYIERLYNEGEAAQAKHGGIANSRWFISHKSTWEANPSKKRSDFDDEYEKDAENAAGKYECNPPLAMDRFLKNTLAVTKAFPLHVNERGEPLPNVVEHELYEGEDPDNPGYYGWQARFDFADDLQPKFGRPYAVHMDLAHTGDWAGFAMSHVERYVTRTRPDNDAVRAIKVPEVHVDLIHYFPQGPHGEIELRWTRQLLFRLVERGFPIQRVTLDGYQSLDTIQILNSALGSGNPKEKAERRKIAENYSLDRTTEGYDTLKSQIYSQLLHGYRLAPKNEGTAQEEECIWFRELLSVQRTGGNARFAKIDHPPYGTKDVADAIAGSVVGAIKAAEIFGLGDFDDLWVGGAVSA